MFVSSNAQAQKIELNDHQEQSICNTIRYQEKGETTTNGSNLWRYEEVIHQVSGSNVNGELIQENIKTFILENYYQIKCDKYLHYPEGYLLEQFAMSDGGDGYTIEFVISNHINVYEMMHSDNQTFMEWLDEKIESHITSEAFKDRLNNVWDELNLLMEYYPFTEENIEAFYEAQWGF